MISKARRLVSGSILGGISFVLRIFISLFMTPFMIMSLGDQTYGLWMLVASFSGFYGVLDFGLSTAVQRYMSRSIGAEDHEDVNSVFNTSLVVFMGIAALAMLMAGVIAWLAPVFVKSGDNIALFRIVILIASVNIVIGFPMRSFWGIFASNLRYDVSVWLEMANVIVKAVLIIAFLKYGFGVIAVAVINLIADLFWHIANIIFSLKVAPYIKISLRYFNIQKIREFLGYSIYVFISKIANLVKYNIDNYVISAFVGLSAVTVYSIGVKLVQYAGQFLFKSLGIMTPVFSQYEGKGDFESIKENFHFLMKITTYVAVFLCGTLAVLTRPFIERWVGLGYSGADNVVFILIFPILFQMVMAPSGQLLYGISKHKFLAWLNGAEALVNLILSLILVQYFGILGVAIGTALPMLITRGVIQPIYTAKVLAIGAGSFFCRIGLNILKPTLVFFIFYAFSKNIISASYLKILIFSAFQAVGYIFVVFYFGFNKKEKDQILGAMFVQSVKSSS